MSGDFARARRRAIIAPMPAATRRRSRRVGTLAARTGIDQKKLSPHLGKLKDLGLLFSQREGKGSRLNTTAARIQT